MASLFGRKVVAYKVNKSGGSVVAGDVVVPDTTNDNAFTTTTSAAVTTGVWVADETIANNATGRVVLEGHVTLINVSASVTRGHTGTTHTVAKQAVSTGAATRTIGTFCKFTTGGTTPEADIWPVDLLGTSLSNPMTTKGDIILGDTGGTPTRLAVGSTSGHVLTSNGSAAFPSYQAPAGGITRTTLGTTSTGASDQGTRAAYAKKVTMASAGLVASINAAVKGNGSNDGSVGAAIYADNGGVPGNIRAVGFYNGDIGQTVMNTSYRFLAIPIGVWLTAADYWLAVHINSGADSRILLAYAGSGADYSNGSGAWSWTDASLDSWASSSNDYSIYADILR